MPNDEQRNPPLKVLYFARLSDELGTRQESLDLPQEVITVGDLQAFLAQRQGVWSALCADSVRTAVNQEIAKPDAKLEPGDEVAFFPPVTGG